MHRINTISKCTKVFKYFSETYQQISNSYSIQNVSSAGDAICFTLTCRSYISTLVFGIDQNTIYQITEFMEWVQSKSDDIWLGVVFLPLKKFNSIVRPYLRSVI